MANGANGLTGAPAIKTVELELDRETANVTIQLPVMEARIVLEIPRTKNRVTVSHVQVYFLSSSKNHQQNLKQN